MSAFGTATPVVRPRVEFDDEVEEVRDDLDRDYTGWFCVETDPWPCPAQGCSFVALHMTAAHLIVCWPRRDDPSLLAAAANARDLSRNPRIVEYKTAFGPSIAWDEWQRIGRPVHGQAAKPDGWDERAKDRL